MMENNCIFCKIANGEIPSRTVYEDADFRAILDLGPATKGHTLILPKSHAADLYELPDETIVLPGHGPATNIAYEKRYNLYTFERRK